VVLPIKRHYFFSASASSVTAGRMPPDSATNVNYWRQLYQRQYVNLALNVASSLALSIAAKAPDRHGRPVWLEANCAFTTAVWPGEALRDAAQLIHRPLRSVRICFPAAVRCSVKKLYGLLQSAAGAKSAMQGKLPH